MSQYICFPSTEYVILTMPEPNILLITINRQKQYNALSSSANWELHHVFNWAEQQEQIWCIVVSRFKQSVTLKNINHAHYR